MLEKAILRAGVATSSMCRPVLDPPNACLVSNSELLPRCQSQPRGPPVYRPVFKVTRANYLAVRGVKFAGFREYGYGVTLLSDSDMALLSREMQGISLPLVVHAEFSLKENNFDMNHLDERW